MEHTSRKLEWLREHCADRYISEDGMWLSAPRMVVLFLFAAHVIEVALCIEFGFGRCNVNGGHVYIDPSPGLNPDPQDVHGEPGWCLYLCDLGWVFLLVHVLELIAKGCCAGGTICRKHVKADIAIVAVSIALFLLSFLPTTLWQGGWKDHMQRLATTLPTARLIFFWRSTKL